MSSNVPPQLIQLMLTIFRVLMFTAANKDGCSKQTIFVVVALAPMKEILLSLLAIKVSLKNKCQVKIITPYKLQCID